MATWFAQNSSVNIDSVNQWNSAANGSGSWLTWASLDPSDILVANGKTSININVGFTCSKITTAATGGTDGGTFVVSSSVTFSASVESGNSTGCLLSAGGSGTTVTITGNATTPGTLFAARCISHSGDGSLVLIGNPSGGAQNGSLGIANTGIGSVAVTGNPVGGAGLEAFGVLSCGILNTSSGSITVTGTLGLRAIQNRGAGSVTVIGNQTGSTQTQIRNESAGSVTVIGNCVGSSTSSMYVLDNRSSANITITGNLTGGVAAEPIRNSSGAAYVVGTMTAANNVAAYLAASTSGRLVHNGNAVSSANGTSPYFSYPVLIDSTAVITHQYRVSVGGVAGTDRSLYTGGVNLGQPVVENVRSGTLFGASSEYTGTLAVPSPTLVAIGVPTDNTVGSYNPSVNASDIRSAIGLAAANLDTQLSGIQSDTNDIQTRLPAALESGRIAAVLDSATAAKIDAILVDTGTTLPAQIAGISAGSGTGARTVTITVNDGTTALQNATVRMTEGANTFTATTNVSGVAVFNLDDATYTVGVTKSGYSYAGTTLVVNGTETETYSMTLVSITPPTTPGLSAIVVLCLDAAGQPEADVDIDIRIVTVPSGSTNIAYKGSKQTATSNVNGIAQFEVVQGSVCEWKRGKADVWSRVTIDSDSVTNVTSVIGSP